MRKEAYYLPNLNSLIMQNREYQRHRQKVKQSKSEIQIHTLHQAPQRKEIETTQNAIKKLTNIEILHPMRSTQGKRTQQKSNLEVNQRYQPTPYEKRMHEQQQRENLRMCKAMDLCSPTIEFPRKRQQQSYSAIKERISKYTKDGGKIIYKFKRSLIQIEKRKNLKDEYMSQRSHAIQEKAKERMEILVYESSKLKGVNKTEGNEANDIFYNDGASIRLNKDTSSVKLKQSIHNRSFTPQNLAIYSNIDQRSIQAKTEAVSMENPKGSGQEDPNRNAYTQLLQKMAIKQQFRRLNRDIILNSSFNPQRSKENGGKGRKKSKLSQLEIVQIPSVLA